MTYNEMAQMAIFLGTKEIDHSEVSIDGQTRRKHLTIFGKSGTGKTTLIRNAVTADLHAGNVVTVIYPHRALIEDLLESIPRRRTNDVIYINPAQPSLVIVLNIIHSVRPEDRVLFV